MKIHNIQQGTEEWHELRKGRLTASNAQAISANGKGLDTYIDSVMAEYLAHDTEKYTSFDIERGLELEPVARQVYELTTGNTVKEVGFIELDEHVGCSPDGLVGEEGGIEIKCLNNQNHFKMIIGKDIDPKYMWQIQMCLLITGRKWWDFVSYNEHFDDHIVIRRIKPNKDSFKKLEKGLEAGRDKLIKLKKLCQNYQKDSSTKSQVKKPQTL